MSGYVEHIDRVVTSGVAHWPTNDPRFLFYPAIKQLTLDVASLVFMGHEPDTDNDLVAEINRAFTRTTRAGGAFLRYPVPPFKWWRGMRGRKFLEDCLTQRIKERRGAQGTDMLTVLCHTDDEDGNRFSDEDIVNHMILLLMAAHDTSTSALTTIAYHLAAHPKWQERCRDESARLGDELLDLEALEKLETLDLVMNESLRMVPPLPFVMRQTVRDTELLGYYLPAGTPLMVWPGMNHRLSELWTEPEKYDPERFAEPRAEHKQPPLRVRPFRRWRAQVHWHGVQPIGNEDGRPPAATPIPAGVGPAGLSAALGLRRDTDPGRRHADRAAPVTPGIACYAAFADILTESTASVEQVHAAFSGEDYWLARRGL